MTVCERAAAQPIHELVFQLRELKAHLGAFKNATSCFSRASTDQMCDQLAAEIAELTCEIDGKLVQLSRRMRALDDRP